jgi:peroxiredoxin family protein
LNATAHNFDDLSNRIQNLESRIESMPGTDDMISLFVFSGDWDKIFSAFVVATGAAAGGTKVNMFFTFWASAAMRSPDKINMKKSILEKMFGWMLPSGTGSLALSNLNFGGMGLNMMKIMMKQKGISSLEELIEAAAELDVNINICDMSMDIIGFKKEEFRKYPNLKFCGVQKFLEDASSGKLTLYI